MRDDDAYLLDVSTGGGTGTKGFRLSIRSSAIRLFMPHRTSRFDVPLGRISERCGSRTFISWMAEVSRRNLTVLLLGLGACGMGPEPGYGPLTVNWGAWCCNDTSDEISWRLSLTEDHRGTVTGTVSRRAYEHTPDPPLSGYYTGKVVGKRDGDDVVLNLQYDPDPGQGIPSVVREKIEGRQDSDMLILGTVGSLRGHPMSLWRCESQGLCGPRSRIHTARVEVTR